MGIHIRSFNLILSVLLAAVATGCAGVGKKSDRANLHVFAQANDGDAEVTVIEVFRANPMKVRIEKEPFVDETMVLEAKVIDEMGGYSLEIQFDRIGTGLLQQYSGFSRGRRLAFYTEFQGGEIIGTRWLAAPVVRQPIHDGKVVFTPDATRQEAEIIAKGLNIVAKKYQH